jgi:hypothetical protein
MLIYRSLLHFHPLNDLLDYALLETLLNQNLSALLVEVLDGCVELLYIEGEPEVY